MANNTKFRTEFVNTTGTVILPKFFVYYLRDNHGIDLNATPTTPKDVWLKFRYTRNHTFNQINHWYFKLLERFDDSQQCLHWEHEQLLHKWGINFTVPFDFTTLHSNDWNKPSLAVPALKNAYERIPTRETIRAMSKEIDKKERATWVEELMQTAKQQNATFVVMKTSYAPYPENMERFNEHVAQRKECSIRMMCIGLEWLACPVEKLPEMLLEDVGKDSLSRKTCTVEFIVS